MLQFFEWYYPADGSLWNHFKEEAERLKKIGIVLWLSRNKITARTLSVFHCHFSADSSTLCYTIVRAPSSLKGDRWTCVRFKRRDGEPLHPGCIVNVPLLFTYPVHYEPRDRYVQPHCQDACANTRAILASFYPYLLRSGPPFIII